MSRGVEGGQGGEDLAGEAKPYRTPFCSAPDNPWWIAPFLGRVPDVPAAKIRMLGLSVVAWWTPAGASNVPMISVAVFAPLAAGLVLLFLPETGSRELAAVSAERPLLRGLPKAPAP